MFCPNCGNQMPDTAKFCSKCGTPVGQAPTQNTPAGYRQYAQPPYAQPPYAQPPYAQPQNTPPDVRMVTPNIGLGPDGKYRWIYEMSLFRNPSIFLLVWKIFFFICTGIFAMIVIIDAAEGYMDGERALNTLGIFGIVLGVMTALVGISFLIYAAIMGGKYIAMFEMDENGVNHKQLPAQAKKARGIATAAIVIGMLSNSSSALAGGMAAANTEMYTSFSKTKKVRFYPKRDTIKIRHTLMHNQVYAKPEDFAFVQDYILRRVPDSAKPKM